MKKRLLSALLALALVFVLLPTTALAGETTYSDSEITISGKYWNFGNKGTSGEYAPVYFRSNGTAFEESEPTGSNYLEIRKTSANEITIKVHGTVDLTEDKNSTNSCISVNSAGMNKRNLIITGAAKGSTLNLTCKNYSHPLYSYEGSITINGGVTVNATSQYSNNNNNVSVYGIQVSNGHNLTISGANTKVNVANKTYDSTVKVDGNITVSGGAQLKAENKSGKVTGYTSKKAYAIECGGQLSISGDKTQVTADTSNGKKAISGTVNNGDKLTFKAANYKGSQIFLQRPMDEALGYKYVEITQAPTDPYVLINGQYAIIGQETPIPGGTGTYLYKKTTHDGSFLTLKGVDITGTSSGPARFIQFGKNGGYYTIQLEGENKISGFSSGIVAPEDPGVNDVTVVLSGSGSLDISANQYAIDMQVGNLKFENTGEIKLTTGYVFTLPLNALRVKSGSIIIDNTKYDIVGVKQDKDGTREDISDNPNLDTILKGTSTDKDLYFKSITITPAAAKDSTIRYNGTTLKQGETITDGNGGTATVDRENNTITLKNFNGTAALSFDATLADSTLVLEGTSTLSSIVTTQKGLTISGSGSLTVGSIRVTNNDNISADLTINGGAHVTVNRPSSEDKPAVEVSGNLTVTGDGTQLSAECTAATNPAIEVGGNVTISGNPGTNAYTVKAHNKYATQRGRVDNLRPSQMPSAIEISGDSLSISNSARVMAKADSDGAAVWMPAQKVISVVDASLIAQNSSHNFSTISFGDESNMGNIYAKGQEVNIVAENMLGSNSSLAHKAIKAFIYNHYNTGDSNPYYIKVVSEGVQSGDNVNVIPGHCTSTGGYKVTITRGDEVTRTNSPVVIAGTTLLNDTYYTITDGSTVAEGTESNYNAFYDSDKKTLKLNNASINGAGTNKAIEANVGGYTFTIELVGNNIIKTSGFANNVIDITGNLYFTGSGTAEISGKGTPIYATYKIDVSADVTITNTEKAGSFTFSPYGENSSDNYKGANTFAIGAGYTAYATTDKTTWAVYDNTTASENESYTTLRITTQPLETGGGSTHQHTYDQSAWKSDATHHWRECTDPNCPDPTKGITNKAPHSFSNGTCTICGYRGQTEEHHFSTDWTYDETHHWHACTDDGCTAIKDKAPHEWTGWRIDEPSPGMHNRFCNCGYNDYSHHYNLVYAAAGEAGHYQYCTLGNCTFKTSTVPHNYDGDTCTICNYTKSGEIVPPTPDNPGTIVIIRPAEEEKPAQQPNPSTGANDLVGLAVAAAVAAALGSAALLRKHD